MVFVPSSGAERKTARSGRPWRLGVVHVREEDGVLVVADAAAKPASGPRDDAAGQEVEAPGRGELGSRGAERRARPAAGLGRGGRAGGDERDAKERTGTGQVTAPTAEAKSQFVQFVLLGPFISLFRSFENFRMNLVVI
jgi:hypothetical protein